MTETIHKIVYIVDDDEGVRKSLSALLQSVGITARTFASAEDLLLAYQHERPTCMLVDVRMPGMSGLELQRRLVDQVPQVPLVMITGHGDVAMAVQAMKEGAIDFLEKPFNEQELIELVNRCMGQSMAAKQAHAQHEQARHRLNLLSEREQEVLKHLLAGKSSKQIASALELSPKTVDVHRSNIMRKTEQKSIAELVRLCLKADSF
jgi:FixJ family two-component response regulator